MSTTNAYDRTQRVREAQRASVAITKKMLESVTELDLIRYNNNINNYPLTLLLLLILFPFVCLETIQQDVQLIDLRQT